MVQLSQCSLVLPIFSSPLSDMCGLLEQESQSYITTQNKYFAECIGLCRPREELYSDDHEAVFKIKYPAFAHGRELFLLTLKCHTLASFVRVGFEIRKWISSSQLKLLRFGKGTA